MRDTDRLTTGRLVLRRWGPADRAAFAELNADPEVMALFPSPLTRAESDALVDHYERSFAAHGYGDWAVVLGDDDGPFLGAVGLLAVRGDLPFAPAVEVGWRLARPAWGRGYATEAARAALDAAFGPLGLDEVVSFTASVNTRSRAVMERLGLARDEGGDFDHPALPPGHRLERHVLYRVRADRWPGRAP